MLTSPAGTRGAITTLNLAVMLLLLLPTVAGELDVGVGPFNPENRLRPLPSYMIVAPQVVRPDQQVNVYVSVYRLTGPSMRVSLWVRQGQTEYAAVTQVYDRPGSKLLQMKMLPTARPGNYTLRLEGRAGPGSAGILFVNESVITLHPKRVSCFIQTDKSLYKMNHVVRFRVIAITSEQLPVREGSVNIFIKDAKGRPVRRWLGRQLHSGVYEGSFKTTHPMQYGWWTIEAQGWGYTYSQKFRIEAHFPEMFYVNISMPAYIKEFEFALAGVVTANLTGGRNMEGNATILLEVEPPNGGKKVEAVREAFLHFKGVAAFLFPMDVIRNFTSKLPGTKLHVTATVHDFHFLMERSWKQTSVIYDNLVQLRFLGGHVRVFKPGIPFDVYVAVYESDGTPLSRAYGRTLSIEQLIQEKGKPLDVEEKTLAIIPDNSIVKYTFIPKDKVNRLVVRATYLSQEDSTIEMVATRHYTKSGRYLTISTSTTKPEVNKYMVFTLRASLWVPEVHYMLLTRGQILFANTFSMTSRQKTFSVATSRRMVPEARMLVYCVLPDGEVIADSLSFHLKDTTVNNITVTTNRGKDFSGKTLEITTRTHPSTFIAFSTMDYDIYQKGGNRDDDANVFFTRNAVEDELMTYDEVANHSFSHTWLQDEHRRERVHYNAPSYAIDANTTFAFTGLMVFTDAYLARIPGIWTCNDTLGYYPCFTTGCFHKSQWCDNSKACADGADEMGCPNPEEKPAHRPNEFDTLQRMWYYFDSADWAWASYYTKPAGNIEFKVNMPVRSTTWLVGAFALSYEQGLVFTENPPRVDTTKPFYIIVDVTPTAVKGEQLGVRVTIFNYWNQPIEAMITLPKSDDYAFVEVEENGKISSYAPRTRQSTIQTMVYLWPGTQHWIFFPVLPLVVGKVKIRIIAESPINRQVVTKTVSVRWNGVTNLYHTPYFINLVSQGSVIIPNLEIPVDENFWDPELRQLLYVPGSASVKVSLVGDVMGPGFFTPALRLSKVTDYGEGHGQDFVFNFAVNLYWVRFLRATSQLTQKQLDGALEAMIIAMKAIFPYIRTNDGMAMRRKRTMHSVWLSAFTLETLAAGSDPEWEDILYIDVSILNKMASYLVSQQNTTTGAFPFTTNVLDRKFQSILFSEDGTPLNVSLTAYVAIALGRSVNILTGDAQTQAEVAKNLAAGYLAEHLNKITDPFQMCLVTYALYVTNHRSKGNAFDRMRAMRRMDNYVYWSAVPILRDPFEIINTVPFQYPRPLPDSNSAMAVQGTGYALLVYLLNNRFEEAEPIMLWLQLQRYSDHGWAGPQDTIIALQALKEYGERLTNRDLYQLWMTLESTGNNQWKQDVHLDRGNFLNYRTFAVRNKVYGSIRATARGTGLALLQMETKVNVEHTFQLRSQFRELCFQESKKLGPEVKGKITIGGYHCGEAMASETASQIDSTRGFDLEMDKLLFYGRNGSHILYNICMRWVRTDISPTSGAAILEVDIPSGYHVLRSHLNKQVAAGPTNQHRARSPWGKLFVYYDYIGARQCFEFRAERWFPVANGTIQHRVRIYDTFNPGFQNTSLYTTYTLFHLHICQVCGSFQCPYCPFYNTAVSFSALPLSTLLLVTVTVLLIWNSPGRLTRSTWTGLLGGELD